MERGRRRAAPFPLPECGASRCAFCRKVLKWREGYPALAGTGGKREHEGSLHRELLPHPHRELRRRAEGYPRRGAGGHRREGSPAAGKRQAGVGGRGHLRRRPHRGSRPERGPPGGHPGGDPLLRPGLHPEHGLRLRHEDCDGGRPCHPGGGRGAHRLRRRREHEPGGLRLQPDPLRRPDGGRDHDRHHDPGRSLGRLQRLPHGHHGGERLRPLGHHPAGAGRLRGGVPAEGRGGH